MKIAKLGTLITIAPAIIVGKLSFSLTLIAGLTLNLTTTSEIALAGTGWQKREISTVRLLKITFSKLLVPNS
ncbi:MAG: hypothetical protein F6K24_14145 [Okeania sp. SIO2D1]|nr:hypothetical protein [Okeania sp. SIO2D1]